jgi:hypothetical protein
MFYSPFEMFKLEDCGMLDSTEEHDYKVNKAREDMASLISHGANPNVCIDDVLHYNNLTYNSLTRTELDSLLNP